MARSRRAVLLGGGGAAMTALAGCQTLDSGGRPQIDLELSNYTARAQRVKVSLLPEGGNGPAEPVLDNREYTVPASESDDDAAGAVRVTDVASERRYLVRVQLRRGRLTRFHAHYRPAASSDSVISIGIRRDEASDDLFVDVRSV